MEAASPVGFDEFSTGSTSFWMACLQQRPEVTIDALLRDESGADHAPPDHHSSGYSTAADAMQVNAGAGQGQGHPVPQLVGVEHAAFTPAIQPDPCSTGATTNYSATAADAMQVNAAVGQGHAVQQLLGLAVAGPAAATGAEFLHQQSAHTEWDSPGINPVLSQTHLLGPYSVGEPSASAAAVTPSAAAFKDIPSVEGARREHNRLLVNGDASFNTKPDQYSAAGPSTTTAAAAAASSLDLEVNNRAGLPQSGGGALTEAPARGPCKRKKLACGSSSQRSTSELDWAELLDAIAQSQSDPSYTDIKPPPGSTDLEILNFLWTRQMSMPDGKKLNLSLGEQDQTAPKAVRSYVTTVKMVPDKKSHRGYWKEGRVTSVRLARGCRGLIRTWQFYRYDGTKTNWFMDEYIPLGMWGYDLYMEPLLFRKVYKGAEVPGDYDPASPEVEITKKTATAKKHRMRGPDNLVIKGESQAWQHFIKIYDRHPDLEGSKVVYALCCYCPGVLRAGTENGTTSLSTHWKRTCPNKHLQAPSS